MAHNLTVSDRMWEQAQEKSGLKNPASFLREVLEYGWNVVNGRIDSDIRREPMKHQQREPQNGTDPGKIIKIKRPDFCGECAKLLIPGPTGYALIKNKKIYCVEHSRACV